MIVVQIFAEDFGVRPYFRLRKVYNPGYTVDPYNLDYIHAKAYLTYEIAKSPYKSSPGPELSSFDFGFSMDPVALVKISQEFTNTKNQQFKTAANVLDIHAFDPEEDESMYEESYIRPPLSPCPCGCEGPTASELDSDVEYDSDGLSNNCGNPDCSLSRYGNMLPSNAVPKPESLTSSATPADAQISSISDTPANANISAELNTAINAETDSGSPASANAKPQGQQTKDSETAKIEPVRQETWPKLMFLGCGTTSAYAAD